jgi:hypothetical protein
MRSLFRAAAFCLYAYHAQTPVGVCQTERRCLWERSLLPFSQEAALQLAEPLLLSAVKLIARIEPLHRTGEQRLFYEALIARITLSFTHNLVGTINRLDHEPQTLGELFRDLECELEALAISMQLFLEILTKLSEVDAIVKENTNLIRIIALLRL